MSNKMSDTQKKRSVEKNFGGIWIEDKQEYAKDVYLNADESQDVIRIVNEEYGIRGNQGIRVYIDRSIERARDIQSRRNDSTSTNESASPPEEMILWVATFQGREDMLTSRTFMLHLYGLTEGNH